MVSAFVSHHGSVRGAGPVALRGPGQAADSPQFIPVLKKIRVRGPVGRPRTRPDAVAGDKAYSSRGNRTHLRKRQTKAVIPEKTDQVANRRRKGRTGGRPVGHDAELYKERNTVERLINKLKAWRGIATPYDKTPESYLAGLHLRASMIWIKELAEAPFLITTRYAPQPRSRRTATAYPEQLMAFTVAHDAKGVVIVTIL